MNYICTIPSPVGILTAASDGENLTGLWLAGQKYFGAGLKNGAPERDLPIFESVKKWLEYYFSGKNPGFTPPIKLDGSGFRQSVWNILREIPYGKTMTYGEISKRFSADKAGSYSRAAGNAVGRNPISIIVPCHRVIGSGGSLTGYAGGIEAKKYLLKLEGVIN